MTFPIDKPLPFVQSKKISTTAPLFKSATKTPSTLLQESETLTSPSTSQTMSMSFKSMRLAPGTKATNSMAKETEMESSSTKTEATTKASGKTTKWTVGENFFTKEVNSHMKATGAKMSSTVSEKFTMTTPFLCSVGLILQTLTYLKTTGSITKGCW